MAEFEVAIVGASLAGSAAAIKLASEGIEVLLIDKEHHPRPKPCGEGLSGIGTNALEMLGVGPRIESAEHSPLEGYAVFSDSGRTVIALDTAADRPSMGVPRTALDAALFETALTAGPVQAALGASVRGLKRQGGIWTIETDERIYSAKQILVSTGTNTKLLQALEIPTVAAPDTRFGLTYHCTLSGMHELRCVSIILGNGFELFCTPLGGSQLNVSAIGSKEALRRFSREQGEEELFEIVEDRIGITIVDRTDALGSGPFGRNATRAFCDGGLLAGDSLESFDPIGGMGMTHALLSGMLASEALGAAARDRDVELARYTQYAHARASMARPFRGFTRMTKYLLTRLGHTATFRKLGPSAVSKSFARTVHDGERRNAASLLLQLIGWR